VRLFLALLICVPSFADLPCPEKLIVEDESFRTQVEALVADFNGKRLGKLLVDRVMKLGGWTTLPMRDKVRQLLRERLGDKLPSNVGRELVATASKIVEETESAGELAKLLPFETLYERSIKSPANANVFFSHLSNEWAHIRGSFVEHPKYLEYAWMILIQAHREDGLLPHVRDVYRVYAHAFRAYKNRDRVKAIRALHDGIEYLALRRQSESLRYELYRLRLEFDPNDVPGPFGSYTGEGFRQDCAETSEQLQRRLLTRRAGEHEAGDL
jgi:hypothetical protein